MKKQIIDILSQKLNADLVKDLVNSYVDVKDNHIKGDDEIAISKAGKFVEDVFRVLKYVLNEQVLPEIKQGQFNKISEDLMNANGSTYPESVRILIPKIALSLIYDPRSKSGAIHRKPINPDFIDGKLVAGTCDWIIAEFLRLYYTRDPEEVEKLIKNVVKDYIPVIEKIGNQTFVNVKVNCDEEILIRLFDVDENGLTRKELGNSMKQHFERPTITNALRKLLENRDIALTDDKKYVILEPGKKRISPKIIELSR